jgi:Zn-dependent protease
MDELNLLQRIAIWTLPVLFAITVHEVAHGWVAMRLGDRTAMMLGRLTLNPIKHIDPIGTLLVPGLMLAFSNFIFGWAKPVPVTWENLRHPKRDMALVAAAGPMANLLMALLWVGVMKLSLLLPAALSQTTQPLLYMGAAGIQINLVLMLLNLLPLPPLDGGRIVSSLLPDKLSWRYNQLEKFGFLILLVLLATGGLQYILGTPFYKLQTMLYLLVGL